MRTSAEVLHAFTPVGKLPPGHTQRLLRMETLFKDAALEIVDLVPESADRTAALRKLLEAKMTCVQAISHDTGLAGSPSLSADLTSEKASHGKAKKAG